jgi:hypothetical protein
MADYQEALWREEFERFGEEETRRAFDSGLFQEPKRQFAFRWLGDKAIERRERDKQTFWYVRWTFVAAVAAVLIGIIRIIVSLFRW